MPAKRVAVFSGCYYHIYNKAVEENLLFFERKNYVFFLKRVEKYLLATGEILAYCLMPNHYHMIVKILDEDFSSSMHKLALSYVVPINRQYGRKGHLFQSTYQRKLIKDIPYLLHLSRYIHLNPVKANLVTKAEDWEFSSYRIYIGLAAPGFIQAASILDLLDEQAQENLADTQANYRKFVESWDFRYMSFQLRT